MSARLASAIASVAAKPSGVTMRRGVAVTASTVELADGVVIKVPVWAVAAPSAGQVCLVITQAGSMVGIPLLGAAAQEGGSDGDS